MVLQRYLGTVREEETLNILLEFVSGRSISSLLGNFGSFPEDVSNHQFPNCTSFVSVTICLVYMLSFQAGYKNVLEAIVVGA